MKTFRPTARRSLRLPAAETEPARTHPPAAVRAGAIALIAGLLLTAPSAPLAGAAKKKVHKHHLPRKTLVTRRREAIELPNDAELPGLEAIRAACLGDPLLVAGPEAGRVEFLLRGYRPGSRATFEARAGCRRVAVKAYAEDPALEAALYAGLASAGLGGDSGARVPPLLAWQPELRLLVMSWLEGPTARYLVKSGRGRRASD